MSDNLTDGEQQALNRDIGQLESLIDELLTYARLDRPQVALNIEPIDLPGWLQDKVADIQLIHPERDIELNIPHVGDFGGVDLRLMERVLDNLVNNGLRYSERRLRVGLWFDGDAACLQVEDDGPGIPQKNANGYSNPSSASIPAAIALPAAAGLDWRSCIPSP